LNDELVSELVGMLGLSWYVISGKW